MPKCFLRHATNRFEAATKQIAEDKLAGRMSKRAVVDADYVRRRALPLPESSRYDWIMAKASSGEKDLPALITDAMKDIEKKFEPLQGVLL
jgi:type I restriction enzyme M protein